VRRCPTLATSGHKKKATCSAAILFYIRSIY
jgi:hypothetical protein